ATVDNAEIHLFDMHRNPNDKCAVGRHIKPVLTDMFESVENVFAQSLAEKTLADCIADIHKRM
ncbi:MAG: Rrf2 family transcriptional regulator, partial [Candidatus Fimenecus sp.]